MSVSETITDPRQPAAAHTVPAVSVVVEWDNFKPSKANRAVEMLRRLDRQVSALGRPGEIIVTFNSDEVDQPTVERWLERAAVAPHGDVDVRVEGRAGIEYHQLKNAGGEVARGEVIAFIDSDVVPDDAWLPSLLEPFADPGVDVVGGATYCGPLDSLYNRSFAAFWRFEPKPRDPVPRRIAGFWSNNVAFRREVFARHRWPVDERIRAENVDFCQSLVRAGVTIWLAPRAAIEHSPPGGPGHLLRYGLSDGYNRAYRLVGTARSGVLKALALAIPAFIKDMLRMSWKIVRRRRAVGIRSYELPVTLALALCMAAATTLGLVLAPLTGDLIARRFQF